MCIDEDTYLCFFEKSIGNFWHTGNLIYTGDGLIWKKQHSSVDLYYKKPVLVKPSEFFCFDWESFLISLT